MRQIIEEVSRTKFKKLKIKIKKPNQALPAQQYNIKTIHRILITKRPNPQWSEEETFFYGVR